MLNGVSELSTLLDRVGIQRPPYKGRALIYQLMVRHFGNTNENRIPDGSKEENGCGLFMDITEEALRQIKALGFSHVWLTGVLDHATSTSYPNQPADPIGLIKGKAGSPYAIRDYYQVSPDLAVEPENRLQEFKALLERCHRADLRVLIDFIPNHVSRNYKSAIKPESDFGRHDQVDYKFHPDNNFYYLSSSPDGQGLRLPNGDLFKPEAVNGRVTGNNAETWTPSANDWYETVKLNYGHDYTLGSNTTYLPGPDTPVTEVPRTWRQMEDILLYWTQLGVDGFRVDMAHMVPLEFWRWVIPRVRRIYEGAYFMGEAYDDDPAKLSEENILEELIAAGFNAVYDHPAYRLLKGIYEEKKWANDLADYDRECDGLHGQRVRYLENHDEVRLANPQHWGGHQFAQIGVAAFAALALSNRDPLLLYNGQEFGEKAEGASGFSGDDGRTTIFDYWGVKSLQRWLNWGTYNGALLREEEQLLRRQYKEVLQLCQRPIFSEGLIYDLNNANRHNPTYDCYEETSIAGGHYVYGFLRHLKETGETVLVVINLHPSKTITELNVWIPKHARLWAGLDRFEREKKVTNVLPASYQIILMREPSEA